MTIGQANDWITWVAILLPTLIPAASAFGTVYWIFKLTTEKETRELDEHKKRATSVTPSVWLQLSQLVKDASTIDGTAKFRDLEAKAKGICEYCEIATHDVYNFSSIHAFSRFAHLKRIALYFREEVIRLGLQTDSFTRDAREGSPRQVLEKVLAHVRERMDGYAELHL